MSDFLIPSIICLKKSQIELIWVKKYAFIASLAPDQSPWSASSSALII